MKNVDQKKKMKNEKHKMIYFLLVERNINDMIKKSFSNDLTIGLYNIMEIKFQ